MFNKTTKKDKRTNLEKEIDSVLKEMSEMNRETKEYTVLTENLERLYKLKVQENVQFKVSPDVIVVGIFGIAQMLLLLNYEKAGVVTSKALGYVFKGRV